MLIGGIRGFGVAAMLLSVVLLTCGPACTEPERKGLRQHDVWLVENVKSLLQKSAGSRDLPNRQSEALEMTEIWPPEGAIAHFRAVSMCRVSLDTAVDTFATGS